MIYDVAIIGGGPAGLTAAVYALRAAKTVLVIEKAAYGGQVTFSPKIENYPGMGEISGLELADKFSEHAMALGGDYELDEIQSVEKTADGFRLVGEYDSYEARTVIIATGAAHRHLGVPGEEDYLGNGISFCAVCDGAFYNGKRVAVIGGGNSALQEAMLLSEGCEEVTIVQNLPTLTGEQSLADKLLARPNVKAIYNAVVTSVYGDGDFGGIEINAETKLDLDGMFVAIGLVPATGAFKDIVETDNYGYIVAGEDCRTSCEGIFVAGDCRTKSIRQITTATADGATAALGAVRMLG